MFFLYIHIQMYVYRLYAYWSYTQAMVPTGHRHRHQHRRMDSTPLAFLQIIGLGTDLVSIDYAVPVVKFNQYTGLQQ